MNEDKLNQLITDIAVIKTKLEAFIEKNNNDIERQNLNIADHEDRLRLLEDFKSKMIGIALASGVFGGIIGTLLQLIIKSVFS